MLVALLAASPFLGASAPLDALKNRKWSCPFAHVWLEHGAEKASEILGLPAHKEVPENTTVERCSIALGFPGGAHQNAHSPGYSSNCSGTPAEASPYMWPMGVTWEAEETFMWGAYTDKPLSVGHARNWYRFDKNLYRSDDIEGHSTVLIRGPKMIFVTWRNGTDFKNASQISGCLSLDMGGIGILRPDWFLDSRPHLGTIMSQYLGNQHVYHQGKAKLVKQWRKDDFVGTYFVVSNQEHVGADGIHWPLLWNIPGEGAGPDHLRMLYNHDTIDDSQDHVFSVDEEYVAAGGRCWDVQPPSPAPPGSWQCSVCTHVYSAEKDGGGVAFEDLPDDWVCPVCGSPKSAYSQKSAESELSQGSKLIPSALDKDDNSWREIEYTFSPIWVPPAPSPSPTPSGPTTYQCGICEHVYDAGNDGGGAAFEDLPITWRCPVCGAPKSEFVKKTVDGFEEWAHERVI